MWSHYFVINKFGTYKYVMQNQSATDVLKLINNEFVS